MTSVLAAARSLLLIQHLAIHAVWDLPEVRSEVLGYLVATNDPALLDCWLELSRPLEELYLAQTYERRAMFFADAHSDGGITCVAAHRLITQ